MNELITIAQGNIGGEAVQTVNARDIHAFLESKAEFSNWVKTQIERARLLENRDFVCTTNMSGKKRGGHNAKEYHLTTEAGKHISMMSGCDKGFEVRDYFIVCEKAALKAAQFQIPQTYAEALLLASNQAKQLEEQKPLVAFALAVNDATNSMDLGSFAKVLGTGRTRLFQWLKDSCYFMSNSKPYQKYVDNGYFIVIETTFERGDVSQIYAKPQITGKGQIAIQKAYGKASM